MTDIEAAFKQDYAFLERLAERNKEWHKFQDARNRPKSNQGSNFVLHPKRLDSDSESNDENTFHSGTVTKTVDSPTKKKGLKKKTSISFCLGDDYSTNDLVNYSLKDSILNELDRYREKSDQSAKEEAPDNAKTQKVLKTKYNSEILSDNNLPMKKIKKRPFIPPMIDNFDKKFRSIVERTIKILSKIKVILEAGVPPPDGVEDSERRIRRLNEFASRFSRVYLYPLQRQVTDLVQIEKEPTPQLNQKIISVLTLTWQGLQSYYNHLPTSVGKCLSDKLQTMLEIAIDVCDYQDDLANVKEQDNLEFAKALRSHIELLYDAASTFDLKSVKKAVKAKQEPPKRPQTGDIKPKSRFAMYSVTSSFRKDTEWRKSMEFLAKKKYEVKSRYKTAGYKHRPPVEKQQLVPIFMPQVMQRKSSGCVRTSSMQSPLKEDEIETMLALEVPSNSSVNVNHGGSCKQLVRDYNEDNEEHNELRLTQSKSYSVIEKSEIEKLHDSKSSKEKILSVSGAKNARLICIRDDSSIIDDNNKGINNNKIECHDKEMMTEKIRSSSQTQTNVEKKPVKPCIKISRIPKHYLRPLEMLPNSTAINIIQYKFQYHTYRKDNPMYKKTIHVQPWIIMGRVSDQILHEMLQNVAKELEVDEILENLYNAEFQY